MAANIVQLADLFVRLGQVRHHHRHRTGCMPGTHTVEAVLQHQAVMAVQAQAAGRLQKDIRRRFAVLHIRTADDIVEIPCRAGGLQILFDHIAGAGTGHDARHPHFFQGGQQFLQAWLAGNALGKTRFADLPDLVQHFAGVNLGEVFLHMFHQILPGQAPAAGIKGCRILRHGYAQCFTGRFPESIPDALCVKHQAIHIKNHAFYHKGAILSRSSSKYRPIVPHFFVSRNRRRAN